MTRRMGYELHQTIHQSPRSLISRATRISDGCPVILKLPSSDYLDRRRTIELRREYAIARRVEGEGIVRVLGLEEFSDRMGLVLEDFGGDSLCHLLRARGPLDVTTFLGFAHRITAALGHIHGQGVIHKDIKPRNIIVNPETGVLKITDFSLATEIALEAVTPESPAQLVGTLAYMAPEQTGRMNRAVDYRADFYALGATFFEMLTGRRVFPSEVPLELLHAHVAQVPPSPRSVIPELPEALAAIVLKLLAKDPDARYQSAGGLLADLERCQRQLQEGDTARSFELGTADRVQRFRLPQGLYGRASDMALLTGMHALAAAGRCQLLLVTGSAGIGKSSLVHELHRVTAASQGRFAAGKCDQLHRGVPFDAVHQALRHLVRETLAEGEAEIARVRARLLEALGANAAVLSEAVPETRALLGEQPPSAEQPAPRARNRFTLVLVRAIQTFAQPQRPLVLFLDDLQWADSATIALVQALVRDPDSHHLLLVGAYRDVEISSAHPLALAINELCAEGAPPQTLDLAPLGLEEVARMVGEVIDTRDPRAGELARLIHSRTGGNPFAVKEFLRFLHEQGLLRVDPRSGGWEWNTAQIDALEIPDDVAGLMAVELRRLPPRTVELLQLAACLGVSFGFHDLTVAHGTSSAETARVLWKAIARGLVLPLSKDYLLLDSQGGAAPTDLNVPLRFLHDRVRLAAYSLIPEAERAVWHVRTGLRLLEEARRTGTLEERVFAILPHLSHDLASIGPAPLRLELADLHLQAGKRAKSSGSYQAACQLFRAGSALLPPSSWEHEHARAFALQTELAECSYLAGEFEVASAGFSTLLEQARTAAQRASILGMQARLASLNSKYAEALELSLEGLRLLGMELPASVSMVEIAAEMQSLLGMMRGRSVKELLELPQLREPQVELVLGLLAAASTPAYFVARKIVPLVALRIVRLSLEHGNSRFSPYGYVLYGLIYSDRLDDPFTGLAFGQLALDLAERFHDPMLLASVRFVHAAFIEHWIRSARAGLADLTAAYKGAMEGGDWQRVAHCLIIRAWRRLELGDPLPELVAENRRFIELLKPLKDPGNFTNFLYIHQTLLMLSGVEEVPQHEPQVHWPLSRAYQAVILAEQHYLGGRPELALLSAEEAVPWLPFISGQAQLVTHAFYYALSAASAYPAASAARKEQLLAVMDQQCGYLEKCASRSPENYSPQHLLVCAELARVRGQEREALLAYEDALAAARASRFPNMEALVCQQACRFQWERGRRSHAYAYLREALNACERWGAHGKARLLVSEHAELLGAYGGAPKDVSSESRGDALDIASVMKASQAISSELQFSQLVGNLLDIVMQSAGAQRGVLVLRREEDFFVEALREVGRVSGPLTPAQPLALSDALCHAIAHQVLHTTAPVLLDDAAAQDPFRTHFYIASRGVRSVLCTPLFHRKHLLGLLYLENNLTAGAFNASRLEILTMLSTQAAISIENAALYRRLEAHSHTLEQRVAERTEELHQKNAELQNTLKTVEAMQVEIILQKKLAALGTLTAGISHELKNPLNFMNNFSELSLELLNELEGELKGGGVPPEQRGKVGAILDTLKLNTTRVYQHGQRATGIINGMLRHSRVSQSERRETQLNLLVEEAVRFFLQGLHARTSRGQVNIDVALDAAVQPIFLVAEDIRRVILNMLENGCYAAQKKAQRLKLATPPQVSVSTRWLGSAVEIRVRDNGDGVPLAQRHMIFTPFFTTKPPGEGTGLGLSISHEIIVGAHGGRLRLESEEGQYAEFIVELPGPADEKAEHQEETG